LHLVPKAQIGLEKVSDGPVAGRVKERKMIARRHQEPRRGDKEKFMQQSAPKILILGANGQLARNTTKFFLAQPAARRTLDLRRTHRLKNPDPSRVTIVEGDVLDLETLKAAMQGQEVVYANL
jgi:hypothetical protein